MTKMLTSPVSSDVDIIRFLCCFLVLFLALQKHGDCAAVHGASHVDVTDEATRRCYCNDASCVATGYMCKSAVGACYARLSLGAGDTVNIRYACADVLPPTTADARLCTAAVAAALRTPHTEVVFRTRPSAGADAAAKPEAETAPDWTETTCCATDMCNYYFYRRLPPPGVASPATGRAVNDTSGFVRQNSVDRDADEVTCFRSPATTTALVCAVLLLAAVLLTLCVVSALRFITTNRRHCRRCYDNACVERRALPMATKTLVGTSDAALCGYPGSMPGQRCGGIRCVCNGTVLQSNRGCVRSALHLHQLPLIRDRCNPDCVDVRQFPTDTKFARSPSTVDNAAAADRRQLQFAGARSVDLLAASTHVDLQSEQLLYGLDGPRPNDARTGVTTTSGLPGRRAGGDGADTDGSGASSSTLDQSYS